MNIKIEYELIGNIFSYNKSQRMIILVDIINKYKQLKVFSESFLEFIDLSFLDKLLKHPMKFLLPTYL